jgi:hypothetical protein
MEAVDDDIKSVTFGNPAPGRLVGYELEVIGDATAFRARYHIQEAHQESHAPPAVSTYYSRAYSRENAPVVILMEPPTDQQLEDYCGVVSLTFAIIYSQPSPDVVADLREEMARMIDIQSRARARLYAPRGQEVPFDPQANCSCQLNQLRCPDCVPLIPKLRVLQQVLGLPAHPALKVEYQNHSL